ncbi:hypothetical protein A3Q56_02032 [Intoshia linei]|uniref:Acyltransferase 3 domain-containing protein n=1 Tax=Intoshia linei TaxID=1819745 RepID=A0A177B986_9BILA|nr:hypothetical protein A3Q56_02032 [Intoshia linei]
MFLLIQNGNGKPPSGIQYGQLYWYGSFEQCDELTHTEKDYQFKYCHVTFYISELNFPLIGICIPKSCISKVQKYANKLRNHVGTYIEVNCIPDPNHYKDESFTRKFFKYFFITFIIYQIIMTICDFLQRYVFTGVKKNRIVTACSIISNMENILYLRPHNEDSPQITCIEGMKSFGAMGIMYGHYILDVLTSSPNPLSIAKYLGHPLSLLLFSNYYISDCFIVMSSFLVSYLLLKNLNKVKSIRKANWIILFPLYYITVIWSDYFMSSIYYGIRFGAYQERKQNCDKNSWKNYLFIQNFYDDNNEPCLRYLWYIAVDLQLYLIAPFFVALLYKKKKFGIFVSILTILAIIGRSLYYSYTLDLTIAVIHKIAVPRGMFQMLKHLYYPCWSHLHSSVLGILTGYAVYLYKIKKYAIFSKEFTSKLIIIIEM